MKVDNHDFHDTHFIGWTEEDFIKDQLPSVPDSYGSEENKIAFLKAAHKQLNQKTAKIASVAKDAK